ncbi:MAG TPA: acyl-CoA dehydrogenase family protein [Solirubrobacterales bacterium]|nr:acyl-CoA dehydrogenase family protein [Solirubrobacterales bacterium]
MEFLAEDRSTLEEFLPGFDARLASISLAEMEGRESRVVELFREAGGAGLVVPRDFKGHGASPSAAIRVQRAIGARSPSLAVATTMHHFSTASLIELQRVEGGFEWLMLQAIAEQGRLLASGFAEGVRGQGVFSPAMRARRVDGKFLVSGRKKPCSLSRSMDVLTASVAVIGEAPGATPEFAVALVPAGSPGLEVSDFWGSPILAGAQSEAVTLSDVSVEPELVIGVENTDAVQTASFLWFELLITASYLGMASALAERAIVAERGDPAARATMAAGLEAAMASLAAVAHRMERGDRGESLLVQALLHRYAAQDAINRSVAAAVEQLGGLAFIGGEEVAYFASASRALAFHPPQRQGPGSRAVLAALAGGPLEIS